MKVYVLTAILDIDGVCDSAWNYDCVNAEDIAEAIQAAYKQAEYNQIKIDQFELCTPSGHFMLLPA